MSEFDEKFPNLVPVTNCESQTVDGVIELTIKKDYPKIAKKSPLKWFCFDTFKMKLDEKGSFIWSLCDGKRSMQQITEAAKSQFPAENSSMEERVKLFVNQLSRRKLLVLFEKTESDET